MATDLQGSSHRPRAVGGAYDNRKGFIYETILKKDKLEAFLREKGYDPSKIYGEDPV